MSRIIDDHGNTISGSANETGRCATTFKGSNNSLTYGEGVVVENTSVIFNGSNGSLHISDNAKVNAIFIIGDNCHVSIGSNAKFNKPCRFVVQEETNVRIGEGCLLANVKFRTTDNHSIIDVTSGQRINPANDIIIGDHVWIAEDVKVFKGSSIGNGSIIGAGSIVTSTIPPHSLAVGVPAKIVKSGVTWSDERLPVDTESTVPPQKTSVWGQLTTTLEEQAPKRIATFGSSLARQVANNYALLFDGKVVSSVCHNRSDYFCNQLLQKQTEPEVLSDLLNFPFPEQQLNEDREDNILQTLKNQSLQTVGLHRLGKGMNFFQAIESRIIDLLIIDNGIDLTARLYHPAGRAAEPFMLHPKHLDTLPTDQKWVHGDPLNLVQSAANMAKLLSHIRRHSPHTKIVFIQAPSNREVNSDSSLDIYDNAFKTIDCHLLPCVNDRKAPNSPVQLYATYAGMIKGLELTEA